MAEDVDVSALAELVRIRRDEDLLRERLEKMEARKDSVSEVVYRRVKGDYESRRQALESEARAPRERAGREYAKLRGLTSDAGRALEEARLAREEVDFRHDLGEFPDEEFDEKRRSAEELLSGRQARVDELAKLKERFLEAFHSEEELERAAGPERAPSPAAPAPPNPAATRMSPAPPPTRTMPPPGPPPSVPPAPPREQPVPGTFKAALSEMAPSSAPMPPGRTGPTAVGTPAPPVPPPAGLAAASVSPPTPRPGSGPNPPVRLPAPPAYSPDATVAGPSPAERPSASPDATALAPVAVAAPPKEPPEHRSATIQMNVARILVVQEDGQGPEYVLKPEPNSVGRAPDSVIRLPYPDVSRQHATVFPVEGGWKIVDRGSPNGLFVNGGRVKEHVLADGDVIQVGRRKLVFRC